MVDTPKDGWNYPDDLLVAAMGLISNAQDWYDDDRHEWQAAAREWLDAFAETADNIDDVPDPVQHWWPEIGDEVWYNRQDQNDRIGVVVGFVPEDAGVRAGQPIIEADPGQTFGKGPFDVNTEPKKVVVHPRFLLPFPYGGPDWKQAEREGRIQ